MFERFTDRSRRVIVYAQEEARLLNHNYIGTEHILLGLAHEGDGVAARALESLGISLEQIRQRVEEIIGAGTHPPKGHVPFTPRAKKVLELSLREARQLGHDYIGTEHILLGLVREGEGVAAQVLVRSGAELGTVREALVQLLSGMPEERDRPAPPEARGGVFRWGRTTSAGVEATEPGPRCLKCDAPFPANLTWAGAIAVGEEDATRRVVLVYCRHCGATLSVLEGDEGAV